MELVVTSLAFNSVTKQQLEKFALKLPGSLLLTGAEGIGLTAAAQFIVANSKAQVTTVLPEKDEKVDLEKGSITVDSIRRLYAQTKTIEPNGRIIIIDFAERMAKPAQNAFLKLLEEPGEGTHFILLTHQPGLLLPTILSRVQRVDMRLISKEESRSLLDALKVHDERQRAQLLFIASGLPAELTRLVKDATYFEQRVAVIKDAREFVIGNAYSRLLLAKKYKDDRNQTLVMLSDAMRLLQKTLVDGGSEDTVLTITKLEEVYGRIQGNANIRLQLASV
ncbi:MAG: AAA family ATPase [Candidatus Microsaccharimonas sp.]